MSLINVDFPNQPAAQSRLTNQSAQSGGSGYRFDLLDLVRRKFWYINFFVILGIALSLFYFFKAPKTYESTAKIFVDEKNAPVMNSGEGDSFTNETSIEQYLVTLKSTKILAPAIERGKFHSFKTFSNSEDILFDLRESKSLTVKPADFKSNSGVIALGFTGSDADECRKVLEEIVASFDDHIKSTTKNIGGETAELVGRVQDEMLTRLKEVETEIQDLMTRPELLNIDGRIVNPHQMQLNMTHQELQELRRERIGHRASVANIEKSKAEGRDMQVLVREILRETSDITPNSSAAQAEKVQLKMLEQELLNLYGADHPDIRKIRKQLNVVDQMVVDELAATHSSMSDHDGVVDDYVGELKRKIEFLDLEEKGLLESVSEEQRKSTSVSALVENLNALQRERERLEKGYYTIIERLSEIKAYNEHLWRNLSVLDPPSKSEIVAPSLPVCLASGLFLGSLLGLLFAGFKDMAEKTFRSADDVAGVLNSQVIGHICLFQKTRPNKRSTQFPNVQPDVVTIHAPASQSSEAYRAIRTSVFFKAQETGAKVIQITSPTPGDGKSTTISNLAASIAQAGRRVLVIDADLRKPVQHKLFGVTNDVGLTSIISGETDPIEAVQVIQPEYLSIVTSGPIPSNPAELLTSSRFAETIEKFRDDFDYILVDTPPMLAVTDPSIVCGHVDLVYLVMRIRNGVRTSSINAKQIIASMGIELGGVIINGIRRRDHKIYEYSGQYGYNGYSYANQSRKVAPTRRNSAGQNRPPSRV